MIIYISIVMQRRVLSGVTLEWRLCSAGEFRMFKHISAVKSGQLSVSIAAC